MLRVLDLRESSSIGGINTQLIRIYPALAKLNGLSLTVGYLSNSPEGWLVQQAKAIGLNLAWIPYHGPRDISALSRLASFIQSNEFDVVHTQGFRGNVITRVILDMKKGGFKVVITKHGIIDETGVKIRLYSWLDNVATNRADKVVAVDKQTYHRMLKSGIVPEKLIQINNPAPEIKKFQQEHLFCLRKSIGIPDHHKILIFVGRMVKGKGIFDLVEAHRLLTIKGVKVVLLFVGDGKHLSDMSQIIKDNKIENVFLLGPQTDVDPYIQISDLLVLPSYGEGMPNVILEALAACKPVVATRVGGIPDVITDGWNGYLVQPQDIVELANKIEFALSSDRFLDIKRYDLSEYSQSSIALKYFNLYNEVTNAQS